MSDDTYDEPTEAEVEDASELFHQVEMVVAGHAAGPASAALGEMMACIIAYAADDLKDAYRLIDAVPGELRRVMRMRWQEQRQLRSQAIRAAPNSSQKPS